MRKVICAAYDHVERVVKRADGSEGGGPWWFGWAVREAFIAGARWQCRAQKLRKQNLPPIDEIRQYIRQERVHASPELGMPNDLFMCYDYIRRHMLSIEQPSIWKDGSESTKE